MLLLRTTIHLIECVTEGVEMQELEVVQFIFQYVVLVEMTTHQVSEMDDARMNEGARNVAEDDRLQFCDGKEDCELGKMGNKLKPAGVRIAKSVTLNEHIA